MRQIWLIAKDKFFSLGVALKKKNEKHFEMTPYFLRENAKCRELGVVVILKCFTCLTRIELKYFFSGKDIWGI